MRYVFIINPKAGKKNPRKWFFPKIEAFFAEHEIPYRIRVTEYAGHATEIVREEAAQGETIRAIAVGGDGTLREVACGAAGLPNVEVGLLPCGSGNDYLRIYGTKEDFLDPERLVGGQSYPVDMIESDFLPAMNVCSVGIDSQVAMDMVRYKNLPLVTGSMAYNIALLKAFCGRIGVQMKVTVDGEGLKDVRYEKRYRKSEVPGSADVCARQKRCDRIGAAGCGEQRRGMRGPLRKQLFRAACRGEVYCSAGRLSGLPFGRKRTPGSRAAGLIVNKL